MKFRFVTHEGYADRLEPYTDEKEQVGDYGVLLSLSHIQAHNHQDGEGWTFTFDHGNEIRIPYGELRSSRVNEDESEKKSLMRVGVTVEKEAIMNEYESHTLMEIKSEFHPWIRRPILEDDSEAHLTFENATYAEQVTGEPHPKVRIGLANRDGPQPLISGGWLSSCRPIEKPDSDSE